MEQTKSIVTYHELPLPWQIEAERNLDQDCFDASYLEPKKDQNPTEHILIDLSDAIRHEGIIEDFPYNAVITISNNSALLLMIDDTFENAKIKFV